MIKSTTEKKKKFVQFKLVLNNTTGLKLHFQGFKGSSSSLMDGSSVPRSWCELSSSWWVSEVCTTVYTARLAFLNLLQGQGEDEDPPTPEQREDGDPPHRDKGRMGTPHTGTRGGWGPPQPAVSRMTEHEEVWSHHASTTTATISPPTTSSVIKKKVVITPTDALNCWPVLTEKQQGTITGAKSESNPLMHPSPAILR